jgi:hypothetical protein
MTLVEFRHLLDLYGADFSHWPAAAADAAAQLVAADPAAAGMLSQARALDDLIRAELSAPPVADAAPAKILQRLVGQLPAQRRGWWPVELLTLDFSPAWPRLAALASVAVLGFAIGFADLALTRTPASFVTASNDADLSTILFDPDPLPRMRSR